MTRPAALFAHDRFPPTAFPRAGRTRPDDAERFRVAMAACDPGLILG